MCFYSLSDTVVVIYPVKAVFDQTDGKNAHKMFKGSVARIRSR